MILGISMAVIAAGAVLLWIGDTSVAGVEGVTLGLVLMMLGVIGGFVSIMLWSSSGDVGQRRHRRGAS